MDILLRYRNAKNKLEFDEKINITSFNHWQEIIYNPDLISSILLPTKNKFKINIKHKRRKHPHEFKYKNNNEINLSYFQACMDIAKELEKNFSGAKCLIYAPLRGALPIWRCIQQFITKIEFKVYYPVTSSFIFYPEEFKIFNNKNRPASGRYANILELKRIRPFLKDYDFFIYVDEIVSGNMMVGHLKDMFLLKIGKEIPVIAVGLADNYGTKSVKNRIKIKNYLKSRKLKNFIWAGCKTLITEDQKFLLGIHYVDYNLGPNVVPLLNENLDFYNEKYEFDRSVYKIFKNKGIIPDPFCAI